ncbi:MAG: VWA domain-containing protein, partial [Candidatus Riflebacteria bacterium]|nr:VWA domain-containing protein [Candidatus Riflebacteria bacterium]
MTRTLLASLLVVALPAAAVAQGLILPQRIMTPDGPSVAGMPLLVVKSIKVTTEISEQVAKTHVDQMFHNPSRWRMEGQYLFLLPKQASVSDFALYIDGKKTPGELLEKEKARGIYEGIVRRMQDPALLEYMGSNVFQARIFPIEPNSDRRIEMTYQEVLHQDFNLIKYVYPLQMPPHLTQPVGEFVITASIKSKSALKNIYSPTHVVATSRKGENEATVSFEGRNVVPDNDFALYYSTSDQEVGINLVCYRPDAGEDGYFMVLLSPKADPQKGEVMAKDIAFVLDTSGSMLGERIVQAKKALKFCVQSLNREDRFNIITFATEATPFADTLMEATNENLKKAVDFIDRDIKAAGGTNPNEALLEALKRQPADRLRPYMICFITDGEPTVGVVDAKEIVENVKKANHTNVRIFSLGIGEELNTKLIDEVATSNFGVSEYIRPKEDIELKVSNFYNRVASPVLSHLAIDFGKVKTSDV